MQKDEVHIWCIKQNYSFLKSELRSLKFVQSMYETLPELKPKGKPTRYHIDAVLKHVMDSPPDIHARFLLALGTIPEYNHVSKHITGCKREEGK